MDEAKRLLNNEEIERTKHGRKDEASGDLSQNRTASPQPDRDATNCPWAGPMLLTINCTCLRQLVPMPIDPCLSCF